MKLIAPRLLAATILLSLPVAASAHRQWLLPSITTLSGTDGWVSVDAAVSNDLFYADHVAMQTDGIKVWEADGTAGAIKNAATGRHRSTFDVQLTKPGTWKIGTAASNISGTFKLNGADWTVGRRRGPPPGAGAGAGAPPAGAAPSAPANAVAGIADIPADATDIKLVESQSRNEIFVTSGAPTKTVLQPTGKGLEFDPVTHPDDLVADEPARFRFLIDGKPAAGLKVTVIPGGKRFRSSEDAQDLTTGADGTVEVRWPVPGFYWLNATATDTHPSNPRATERRMSYTTTLEVPAP